MDSSGIIWRVLRTRYKARMNTIAGTRPNNRWLPKVVAAAAEGQGISKTTTGTKRYWSTCLTVRHLWRIDSVHPRYQMTSCSLTSQRRLGRSTAMTNSRSMTSIAKWTIWVWKSNNRPGSEWTGQTFSKRSKLVIMAPATSSKVLRHNKQGTVTSSRWNREARGEKRTSLHYHRYVKSTRTLTQSCK